MNVKQVIVMRKKYPDGKGGNRGLRLGKIAAQASHASMAWLSHRIRHLMAEDAETQIDIHFSPSEKEWLTGTFTKVVVGVETEEQLLDIYEKAKAAGLEAHLITDSGFTEFGGVPTHTAVGIGPDEAEKIDRITGHLGLL
jgi:peptidyl-tRNA hydrolase, PTH2 family